MPNINPEHYNFVRFRVFVFLYFIIIYKVSINSTMKTAVTQRVQRKPHVPLSVKFVTEQKRRNSQKAQMKHSVPRTA